jgi:hypothetical protein
MLELLPIAIAEQKDLVDSGDLVLDERRNAFRHITGRHTMLDDEKLLIACAATDDDDDDLFAKNVELVEQGKYKIAA